jgi:hypothetical protein
MHNIQNGRDIKIYLYFTVVTTGNEYLNLDTLGIVLRWAKRDLLKRMFLIATLTVVKQTMVKTEIFEVLTF